MLTRVPQCCGLLSNLNTIYFICSRLMALRYPTRTHINRTCIPPFCHMSSYLPHKYRFTLYGTSKRVDKSKLSRLIPCFRFNELILIFYIFHIDLKPSTGNNSKYQAGTQYTSNEHQQMYILKAEVRLFYVYGLGPSCTCIYCLEKRNKKSKLLHFEMVIEVG